MLYRMVVDNGDGTFSTGANLQGCSPDNPQACDPQTFYSVEEILAYANGRGETPIWVDNVEEAWNIVAGTIVNDYPEGSIPEGAAVIEPEQVTIAGFDSKTMVIVGLVIAGILIRRIRP